ncbi:amidase signature domain-containing protein [Lophiotrema nucula]|uniref:Amidase signature domain-containing protein n=1 Tax=Lophiotrema nucula TaxID=690887 RepID=A0A6A5YIS7_9PLEO|nr:amidase signature domain-containing protein [Lophiotrema nucula]
MSPTLSLPSLSAITCEEIRTGLESGFFTSKDLVNAYSTRTEEVNDRLNAVLEINPDALAIAEQLDKERREGKIRGQLHGVPILVKDNIATSDLMQTTAGAFCLEGAKPSRDATVVTFLRKAGAVILGKTNLSEWANYRSTNSSDGWSGRGGQTYGTYHDKQYACGSSSGSAVATSIGLAFAAVGTETDGSITCPSAYNSIVGIKPTLGLVPRDFVISGSFNMDSVGPMARSVKDAALLLSVMAGKSEFDNATKHIPYDQIPDFTQHCDPKFLHSARIGALSQFRDAGATIVDTDFPNLDEFQQVPRSKYMERDLNDGLVAYLQALDSNPHEVRTLEDIIEALRNDAREKTDTFDVEGLENATRSPSRDSEEYQSILQSARRLAIDEGLNAVMDEHNLDAIILPEAAKVATSIAAVGGFPVITVPLGFFSEDDPVQIHRGGTVKIGPNIPYGLQLIGRHFEEPKLVGYAYAFEQISRVRDKVKPLIAPKTELEDILKGGLTHGECALNDSQ